MLKRQFLFFVFICITSLQIFTLKCAGQNYLPDKNGYISDPGFHRLIKENQFQLVGSFDTLKKYPLSFVAMARKNDQWIYINNSGEIITYNGLRLYKGNNSGNSEKTKTNKLIKIQRNGQWGLENKEGIVLLPPEYYGIKQLTDEGHMEISVKKLNRLQYGVVDPMGKIILQPIYSAIDFLKNVNLLRIRLDEALSGLSDLKGKIVLNPIYDYVTYFDYNVSIITYKGKYGLIDRNLKTIIEPKYNFLLPYYSDKVIVAGKDNLCGVMGLDGTVKIPFKYEELYCGDKIFFAKKDGKWYRLDKLGNVTLKLDFTDLKRANQNFLVWSENRKEGLLNGAGKIILPLKFDQILNPQNAIENGLGHAKINGKVYIVDLYGHEYAR